MARKIRKICWKFGIPQNKDVLGLGGIIIVVFFGLSQLAIAKVLDENFWNGRFSFSVPYEKQENGKVTRTGVFEGEAFWNSSSGCWEIKGKTRESSNAYGDSGTREVKTRKDCIFEIITR